MAPSTMVGVGITPEGINQNYVIYDFALDRGWLQDSVNVSKWIEHYAFVRYGFKNIGILSAWRLLQSTIYNYNAIEKISGRHTVCRRPSLNIRPLAWYNLTLIDDALHDLLIVADNEIENNHLYQLDLVDVTRQMLQNKIDILYERLITAYGAKNVQLVKTYIGQFGELMNDLDAILETHEHFLLGRWLRGAATMATSRLETQAYRFNALNQITLWGPRGQIVDYATKQWAGLVSDYCMPRWQIFFHAIVDSLTNHTKFNERKVKERIFKNAEEPFGVNSKEYSSEVNGDTITLAREIYEKWRNILTV